MAHFLLFFGGGPQTFPSSSPLPGSNRIVGARFAVLITCVVLVFFSFPLRRPSPTLHSLALVFCLLLFPLVCADSPTPPLTPDTQVARSSGVVPTP